MTSPAAEYRSAVWRSRNGKLGVFPLFELLPEGEIYQLFLSGGGARMESDVDAEIEAVTPILGHGVAVLVALGRAEAV